MYGYVYISSLIISTLMYFSYPDNGDLIIRSIFFHTLFIINNYCLKRVRIFSQYWWLPIIEITGSISNILCLREINNAYDRLSNSTSIINIFLKVYFNIMNNAYYYSYILILIWFIFSLSATQLFNRYITDIINRMPAYNATRNYQLSILGLNIYSKPIGLKFLTEDELENKAPLRCPGLNNIIYSSDKCSICMELFSDTQLGRKLPCNHIFHAHCIDPWLLARSTSCPICRHDLLT